MVRNTAKRTSAAPSLLLDVGNSRLKWGLYRDGRISQSGGVAHTQLAESGYSALTRVLPHRVNRVVAGNVAGQSVATKLAAVIGLHTGEEIRFVHSERQGFGITSSYTHPRKMGVDRWAAMIGAFAECHSSLCMVDAGTAVTIDAIDKSGQHLGGQILAGLDLMSSALSIGTSDVRTRRIMVKAPVNGMQSFASSTEDAVSFGAFAAVIGAIQRAIQALRAAGYRPKIILTGEDASRIIEQLNVKCLHRPNLVLQGLAHMMENGL